MTSASLWLLMEIGVFVGGVNFREALREKLLTAGLRFGYRVNKYLAIESEFKACPQNPSGNFGQLLFVAGPRVGVTLGPLTVSGRRSRQVSGVRVRGSG